MYYSPKRIVGTLLCHRKYPAMRTTLTFFSTYGEPSYLISSRFPSFFVRVRVYSVTKQQHFVITAYIKFFVEVLKEISVCWFNRVGQPERFHDIRVVWKRRIGSL